MTFADKKVEELKREICNVACCSDSHDRQYPDCVSKEKAFSDCLLKKCEYFFEKLKQTIAEAEKEGMEKLINYFSGLQKKYENDIMSLLCDYTLRKMIKDCQQKLKELNNE